MGFLGDFVLSGFDLTAMTWVREFRSAKFFSFFFFVVFCCVFLFLRSFLFVFAFFYSTKKKKMSATRNAVLSLYKDCLRSSTKFHSYNFRNYALRRSQERFETITNPFGKIERLIKKHVLSSIGFVRMLKKQTQRELKSFLLLEGFLFFFFFLYLNL